MTETQPNEGDTHMATTTTLPPTAQAAAAIREIGLEKWEERNANTMKTLTQKARANLVTIFGLPGRNIDIEWDEEMDCPMAELDDGFALVFANLADGEAEANRKNGSLGWWLVEFISVKKTNGTRNHGRVKTASDLGRMFADYTEPTEADIAAPVAAAS